MALPKFIDDALDAMIAPGFSRIGYLARSSRFTPLADYSLVGRTVVITGPTSGLGSAAARQMRSMGADLVLVGRSAERLDRTADRLSALPGAGSLSRVVADMGDLDAVRGAAGQIAASCGTIHALVHNAGALTKSRETSAQGFESTIATHVLGPHLLTRALLPVLQASHGRVVTVSSGGMYAATVPDVAHGQSPEMSADKYDGTRQYTVAKRMQVTLNEMWASRELSVAFAAMHPGWADTPGVQESLPVFRAVTRPLLRSAEQGADTISWLVADDTMIGESGRFWCDRSIRTIHRIQRTRRSDTADARAALWQWCDERTAP